MLRKFILTCAVAVTPGIASSSEMLPDVCAIAYPEAPQSQCDCYSDVGAQILKPEYQEILQIAARERQKVMTVAQNILGGDVQDFQTRMKAFESEFKANCS